MKKLFLTSVAALFLATGTAHADSEKWEANFRQCHIRKWFSKDELAGIGWARETEGQTIVIEAEEIPDILKARGWPEHEIECEGSAHRGRLILTIERSRNRRSDTDHELEVGRDAEGFFEDNISR